jgi:vacuolar-type H+-ATPase subunit H
MTQETQSDPEVVVDIGERHETTDILDIVDEMVAHLEVAKGMPLSSNALVDRELFFGLLAQLKEALPDELRAARWMVREREAFIARTNEKAREIIDKAKQESEKLVSESNIVAEAVEEANILVRRAEGDARRLRLETEDDIDDKLSRVEGLLVDMVSHIKAAREELHKSRPKPPEVPV